MNRRALLKIYSDPDLVAYIRYQARRHFSSQDDQEDVISEVWEKFVTQKQAPPDSRIFAYRVIHNSYERRRYLHIKNQLP